MNKYVLQFEDIESEKKALVFFESKKEAEEVLKKKGYDKIDNESHYGITEHGTELLVTPPHVHNHDAIPQVNQANVS